MDFNRAQIMGIVNLTPDSFYDGDRYSNQKAAKKQVDALVSEGADILDVGGMSSRPGAAVISAAEEWKRIEQVLAYILDAYPHIPISVDTIHSGTAARALDLGVHMINDISAGVLDQQMMETVGKYNVPYIMMHMRGKPATMQADDLLNYPRGVCMELLAYFKDKIELAEHSGISDIVIDPGFGFSKTIEQNYEMLSKLHVFQVLNRPVLAGLSRKSMIYKYLGISAQEALNGTTALHMKALYEQAKILRVHDVRAAVEVRQLFEKLEYNAQQ